MNIYEVAIRILPLFPDAQIAEDEDGQIVIMTGVKKADPPPPGTPLFAASRWYLQPCIKLADYCTEQGALEARRTGRGKRIPLHRAEAGVPEEGRPRPGRREPRPIEGRDDQWHKRRSFAR